MVFNCLRCELVRVLPEAIFTEDSKGARFGLLLRGEFVTRRENFVKALGRRRALSFSGDPVFRKGTTLRMRVRRHLGGRSFFSLRTRGLRGG